MATVILSPGFPSDPLFPEVFPEWFFNPYHLHWVRVARQMKTLVISAGISTPYAELMVQSPF